MLAATGSPPTPQVATPFPPHICPPAVLPDCCGLPHYPSCPLFLLREVGLTFADVSVHTHFTVLRSSWGLPSSPGSSIKTALTWVLVPGGQPASPQGRICQPQPHPFSEASCTSQPQGLCMCDSPAWVNPTGGLLPQENFPSHPIRPCPPALLHCSTPVPFTHIPCTAPGPGGQQRTKPVQSWQWWGLHPGREKAGTRQVSNYGACSWSYTPWKRTESPETACARLGWAWVREPSGLSPGQSFQPDRRALGIISLCAFQVGFPPRTRSSALRSTLCAGHTARHPISVSWPTECSWPRWLSAHPRVRAGVGASP